MRTKPNYKGQTFEVTYDKEFEVKRNYIYRFILRREEDIDEVMMYEFGTDIHIQIANVGCVILFTNLPRVEKLSIMPYRSYPPLLKQIYKMIENGECI